MDKTEQKRQRNLERLRSLRPIDDDFMRCLFKDNIPLVEMVLQIITGKYDLKITECQTQKDMKRLGGARSICLDAYGIDSTGKKYDLEIQRADKGADPHRARFHSSVMDIENPKGVSEMCKVIEDMIKEEREEATMEITKTTAIRMLKAGKYALDEISDISGLPIDEVRKLQAKQNTEESYAT